MDGKHIPASETRSPELRKRMRDGRLQQITQHIDRIETELADVAELVARMQRDSETSTDQVTAMAAEPSVTGTCWEPRRLPDGVMPPFQQDSASL